MRNRRREKGSMEMRRGGKGEVTERWRGEEEEQGAIGGSEEEEKEGKRGGGGRKGRSEGRRH